MVELGMGLAQPWMNMSSTHNSNKPKMESAICWWIWFNFYGCMLQPLTVIIPILGLEGFFWWAGRDIYSSEQWEASPWTSVLYFHCFRTMKQCYCVIVKNNHIQPVHYRSKIFIFFPSTSRHPNFSLMSCRFCVTSKSNSIYSHKQLVVVQPLMDLSLFPIIVSCSVQTVEIIFRFSGKQIKGRSLVVTKNLCFLIQAVWT